MDNKELVEKWKKIKFGTLVEVVEYERGSWGAEYRPTDFFLKEKMFFDKVGKDYRGDDVCWCYKESIEFMGIEKTIDTPHKCIRLIEDEAFDIFYEKE